MKKYAWLFLMMFLAGLNLFAQGRAEMGERSAARLKAALSLTDQQLDGIKQINEEFSADQSRLRVDTVLTRSGIQARRAELVEEREAGIRKILTKEQAEKWEALKTDREKVMTRRKRENPREEMKNAVGLSDDQVKKIMEINRGMGEDFKSLRGDSGMTPENRGKAIREIMENRNGKIKKMLTETQYEKFVAYESVKTRHRQRQGQHDGAEHRSVPGRHR